MSRMLRDSGQGKRHGGGLNPRSLLRAAQRTRHDHVLKAFARPKRSGRTLLVGRGASHAVGRLSGWLDTARLAVLETDPDLARSARIFEPELEILSGGVIETAGRLGRTDTVIALNAFHPRDPVDRILEALFGLRPETLVIAQRPLRVLNGSALAWGKHDEWVSWAREHAQTSGAQLRSRRIFPWTLLQLGVYTDL